MKTILLISGALVTLCGCTKAPEPLIEQATKAPPQEVTELAGSSLPLEATPTEVSTPSPLSQYRKPETQAAVEDYISKWQQLQHDGQIKQNLGLIDPLTNRGAIIDYANKIGADANQLDQAERAAKGLMKPDEKKRFKAFQKELVEPE